MSTFRTKDGLLNRIYQDLDESEIREFARELNSNPLMPFKVKMKADVASLLVSLKAAPKEILEDTYEQFVSESEDDDFIDEDDSEEFEDDEEDIELDSYDEDEEE